MNPTLQKILCFPSLEMNEVNRCPLHRFDVAGKGLNVCRVLTQLGKEARHLTPLGGDTGPLFLELSRRENLRLHWVESGSPIRFCYTLINEADRSVTELIENAAPVKAGTEERLLAAYGELLPPGGVVVIAGTKAPGFSGALIPLMTRRAKEAGCKVILDIWGDDLRESLAYGPDVIKPNLKEFAATFGFPVPEGPDEGGLKEQVRERCGELCRTYGCSLVITRGARSVWYAQGGAFAECPPRAVEQPVNTTGSGDAFTGGLAAALGEGRSLGEAVAEGVRCGALNAGFLQVGTIA